MEKQVIYVDLDGVLVDFQSGIDKLTDEEIITYDGRYDEVPNIFSLMEPMPDALNAFKLLSEAIGPVLSKASQESEPIRTLRHTNSGAFS